MQPDQSPEPVDLDGGGLRLRPWRADDLDDAWTAFQDEQMRRWGGLAVDSREDAAAWLGRRLEPAPDRLHWAVVDPGTGALAGSVGFSFLDPVEGLAMVGYWTAPASRGRGLAPLAVDTACRHLFATTAVDRVELFHAIANAASGRVAEKAGFTWEGRLRRSHRYDGVKLDQFLWARLADDPPPALSSRS
ncbi:GNAT family N-acetyltransferase [Blastococcus sp. URHD0036]|uniref:GNAT family N-acetyltransferase n=1 Tax=Blastococcus sp. URHD0036 TaxID=1380356 RepID=UPI00049767D6|nr:GNAT family N-acetyltransferase [Blastococcus sp. URHD0036]